MVHHRLWKTVIAFALVGAIGHLDLPSYAASQTKRPDAGEMVLTEKAPDFILKDLEGRKFRLGDFKGKQTVLLLFGATWCPYCKEEIPRFKAIHATYAKRGLEVVYVDIKESKEKVSKFAKQYGLPYRTVLDEEGDVSGIYGILGVPALVLVDRNGNILSRESKNLEALLETVLKKS